MSIYKLNEHSRKHSNGFGYITRSGHTMFQQDIVTDLKRKEYLEKENEQLKAKVFSPEDMEKVKDMVKENTELKASVKWFSIVLSGNSKDLVQEHADLKAMIKRYIAHVGECNGVDFISSMSCEDDIKRLTEIDKGGE